MRRHSFSTLQPDRQSMIAGIRQASRPLRRVGDLDLLLERVR